MKRYFMIVAVMAALIVGCSPKPADAGIFRFAGRIAIAPARLVAAPFRRMRARRAARCDQTQSVLVPSSCEGGACK